MWTQSEALKGKLKDNSHHRLEETPELTTPNKHGLKFSATLSINSNVFK